MSDALKEGLFALFLQNREHAALLCRRFGGAVRARALRGGAARLSIVAQAEQIIAGHAEVLRRLHDKLLRRLVFVRFPLRHHRLRTAECGCQGGLRYPPLLPQLFDAIPEIHTLSILFYQYID